MINDVMGSWALLIIAAVIAAACGVYHFAGYFNGRYDHEEG